MFAIVYGGFGVLAVALAILLALYAEDRWGNLMAAGPRPPASPTLAILRGIGILTLLGQWLIGASWGRELPGRRERPHSRNARCSSSGCDAESCTSFIDTSSVNPTRRAKRTFRRLYTVKPSLE